MRLIIAQPLMLEAEDTSVEINLSEREDQKFAEALYEAAKNGSEIVMSIEDPYGGRLGVRGFLYDSEV